MNCDVCEKEVLRSEDATILESLVYETPAVILMSGARHIYCSPSRAQYIVHDDFESVVDDRQAFDKRSLPDEMRIRSEERWSKAWVELQEE